MSLLLVKCLQVGGFTPAQQSHFNGSICFTLVLEDDLVQKRWIHPFHETFFLPFCMKNEPSYRKEPLYNKSMQIFRTPRHSWVLPSASATSQKTRCWSLTMRKVQGCASFSSRHYKEPHLNKSHQRVRSSFVILCLATIAEKPLSL